MRKTKQQHLQSLLVDAGMQPHAIQTVVNALYGIHAKRHAKEFNNSWAPLVSEIKNVRRNVATNRHKWPAHLAPIYDEYLGILDTVFARIERAQFKNPCFTLEQFTAHMRTVNATKAQSTGTCGKRWQSWVPPHIVQAFWNKALIAQERDTRTRGNRFTPFLPRDFKQQSVVRMINIEISLSDLCERMATVTKPTMRANTPFRALHLAAARMAQIELTRRAEMHRNDPLTMLTHPFPVHWPHLLTPEMRARVHAAQAAPAAVTTDGLASFLTPDVVDPRVRATTPEPAPIEEPEDDGDADDTEPCS